MNNVRVPQEEVMELIAKQQINLDQYERHYTRLAQEYKTLALKYAEMVEKYTPDTEEAKQIRELRKAAEMMRAAAQQSPPPTSAQSNERPSFVDDVNGNL